MTSILRFAGRAVPALALTCVVAAGVTGCGPDQSGGTAAPASSGAAATTPGTTTPGTTAPGTPAPGAASTAPAGAGATGTGATSTPGTGAGRCATRDLQASVGASQGTAGSTYMALDFKNISGKTCTLYGYPGVSQAGGSPVNQIGHAATESDLVGRALVTLAPGATGNALLRIVDAGNFSSATCEPTTAKYLQIFPPSQTTPIYLAFNSQACAGSSQLLTVSVIRAGVGDAS
ncbi:DUF4232 domain-containing protein [Streptomyces sp. SL13]|uniref:DUF4232 domain-containing protein n=1 Tax=Streptantibioticus silvisoli TaxID=2705255 RepID=A0AA90H3W8_9ACTN|nr:DUF4232 domain-containing protein [Streptantibioticus silvisoli]MDI5969812.1 DUF4232 domain-containing protein [Streptantibioticus silvisoli]